MRQPVVLRHRADLAGLPDRDPGRHRRLHGHRDDLEHGRGGARRGATIPAAIKRVMIAVFTIYFTLPWIALSALPVRCNAAGENSRRCSASPRRRRLRGQPDARHREAMELGRPGGRGALRRRPRGHDPRRRHQRGRARRLAPRLLDGHAPPDARRDAAAAPRSARRTSASSSSRRSPASRCCRAGGLPRRDLRVRRDALVLDGAPRAAAAARHPARPRAALPQPGQPARSAATTCRRSRSLGLAGTRPRCSSSARSTSRSRPPAGPGCVLGMAVYIVYRRRQGLDLVRPQGGDPEPVVEREAEYDSVLVHIGEGASTRPARHGGQARRPPPPRHPRARDDHVPHALGIDAPMGDSEAAARDDDRAGQLQGGRRVTGTGRRSARARPGRRIVVEEAEDMRAAAVVLALPRRDRRARASFFGHTLETVLEGAAVPRRDPRVEPRRHSRPARTRTRRGAGGMTHSAA